MEGALKKLKTYLSEYNKKILLACLFEYYTFIRPNELTQIRIKDESIANQTVFVSSAISKNLRKVY